MNTSGILQQLCRTESTIPTDYEADPQNNCSSKDKSSNHRHIPWTLVANTVSKPGPARARASQSQVEPEQSQSRTRAEPVRQDQETNWHKYDADEDTVCSRNSLPSLQELPKHQTRDNEMSRKCYDCRDNGEEYNHRQSECITRDWKEHRLA